MLRRFLRGSLPILLLVPVSDFLFFMVRRKNDLWNLAGERSVVMEQETAKLHNLFAMELARQSPKGTEVVGGSGQHGSGGGGRGSGKTGKRRAQQRVKTTMNAKSGEQPAEFLEIPGSSGAAAAGTPVTPGGKKGKKKKRSTMANASNPHHLRNYVPSRLPHTGHGQAGSVDSEWPLALTFLSADVRSRGRQDASGSSQHVVPQDEWICSFCEYSLFYGDDGEYKRAVRNRKKILKRRRKARERAAAAASGVKAAMRDAAGGGDKSDAESDGGAARVA